MVDRGRLRTFIVGGIAGALAGILLAPRSGRELRDSIASRAGEARERGRESYFDAQERARERIAEARDRPPGSPRPQEPTVPPMTAAPGGASPPFEGAEEPSTVRPTLRDVSRDASGNAPAQPSAGEEDPEELRRRIQETRSRLRARLDGPDTPSGKGE